MQTLEKYKAVLDRAVNNLSVLEFENIVTLDDVAFVIQRTEMVLRVASEIDRYICELGNEGRLISMQLEELLANIDNDEVLIIEDYMEREDMSAKEIQENLRLLSFDELMEIEKICKLLGYNGNFDAFETAIYPKGYRLLSKIPKVPMTVTRNLVDKFLNFQGILNASIEELDDVEGFGEVRARLIQEGLRRVQGQLFLNAKKM